MAPNRKPRHEPLHVQLTQDRSGFSGQKQRSKYRNREQRREKSSDQLDRKLSEAILSQARDQLEEMDREEGVQDRGLDANLAYLDDSEVADDDNQSWDDSADEDSFSDLGDVDVMLQREMNGLSEEDQKTLALFMSERPPERRNLADIVMEKFQLMQDQSAEGDQKEQFIPPGLNERVVEVYSKVGELLARYKSGPIPKAFKIIPALSNWEDVLYLTRPDQWTPHAVYQATRLFASNLKPKMAQRFYNVILLEAVRDSIAESKKVNPQLYMALRKAMYKPAAWFKGILLPLCEGGCTLREAMLLSSLLAKATVPMLHSAATLMKLAEMEYTGANSMFIRVLLDKKYALPYRVIDALVLHFLQFKRDNRRMPVLWHQSLLVFCQRYKNDMTPEQKQALLSVLSVHSHHQISPEVRRECEEPTHPGQPQTSQMAIDEYLAR